jgi:undecaprenyl-diphosphatase
MDNILQDLMSWITQHPHLSGLLIFTIALFESIVVLGLILPGAFLLFGIGALVSTGALELLPTLLWTSAGAIAGDTISFLLGYHYHQRLRVVWPFRRYPVLVNRGIDFFYRHGGKGVFLARFIGPLRPIVPAIAGMMDMKVARFLVVDSFASLLWAPAYILPGVVFGASLGLAAEVAGRLAALLIVLVGITWLSIMLIRGTGRWLAPRASAALEVILSWSRNHPRIKPLAGSLLDPQHPEARGLVILSGLFFIALWLLLLVSFRVLHGHFLGDVDNYIFHFLQNLRTPWAYQAMVFTTQLGGQILLAGVLLGGILWLVWKGYTKAAWHWLAVYASTLILTYTLKYSAKVARPSGFDGSFSFPSAHTSMSLAVYGFLALLIARELPFRHRWIPYTLAGLLVTAIAFSRLYLGVHWFSDILGGASLGLFWVALIGIAYDRHPAPKLPLKRLLGVMSITLLVVGTWQVQHRFRHDLVQYAPRMPLKTVTLANWQSDFWRSLPVYRVDLEGLNEQPLNVQWAGSLERLEAILTARGWHPPPAFGSLSLMNWLAPEPDIARLPILPQVHDGQHHKLLMVYHPQNSDKLTVLRLWQANVEISPVDTRLGIGTVSYLVLDRSLPLISTLMTGEDFDRPQASLREALAQTADIRTVRRDSPVSRRPGWDGTVLLAWDPGMTSE